MPVLRRRDSWGRSVRAGAVALLWRQIRRGHGLSSSLRQAQGPRSRRFCCRSTQGDLPRLSRHPDSSQVKSTPKHRPRPRNHRPPQLLAPSSCRRDSTTTCLLPASASLGSPHHRPPCPPPPGPPPGPHPGPPSRSRNPSRIVTLAHNGIKGAHRPPPTIPTPWPDPKADPPPLLVPARIQAGSRRRRRCGKVLLDHPAHPVPLRRRVRSDHRG